jgi:hypothetical protein
MDFCAFLNKGSLKTPLTKKIGESPCQKLLAEKVENFCSCRIFPSIFLIAFLAASPHEEPKNTTNFVSKIRPGNHKKSQKKAGGSYRAFS